MDRIREFELPLEVEAYYHQKVKQALWGVALSEYDHILDDMLQDRFKDPDRHTFSVQTSAGLMRSYLESKDDFALLESRRAKDRFLRRIQREIDGIHSFRLMTEDQFRYDFKALNRGFDGLLHNPFERTGRHSSPHYPGINYDRVRDEVQGLYH